MSCLILDDIEKLIEYVRIGPRFSNAILQTILVSIRNVPARSKMIIIGTTSNASVLESLELLDAFNITLTVPSLKVNDVQMVCNDPKYKPQFSSQSLQPAWDHIGDEGVAIKKLLMVMEMARQLSLESGSGVVQVETLIDSLVRFGL